MPWSVVRCPLSVVPRSLAFHFFDISSRTISWIELKLRGCHCGNMKIQNCKNRSIPISKMATMAAILKFFKRQLLPKYKSEWAETWWEASQSHRDSELLKSFGSDIQDGLRPSWNSSDDISSQTLSRIEPKLDGRHQSDTEIQNCQNRSVPISKMATTAVSGERMCTILVNRLED